MDNQRILLAFFFSPSAAPLILILSAFYRVSTLESLHAAPTLFILYITIAYLATGILGFPAFLLYRALGWRNGLLYVGVGAVIGILTTWIIRLGLNARVGFGVYGWSAAAGAVSAFVFWLILFKLGVREGDRLP